MSSAFDARTLLLILAIGAAGCQRAASGDQAVTGATPPILTPVGPVPGPASNPTRRENPFRANAASAAAEGRTLFVRYNCSGCHGGRAGGGMGPSLRDPVWFYGNSDAQIFSSIAEGRDQGMPAWGTMVTEEQTWKLVAYLQTLRTPDEPNPPR